MNDLVVANRLAHEVLDARLMDFLDAAVQGQRDAAQRCLADLAARVERHMRIEEDELLGHYRAAVDDGQDGPEHPSKVALQVAGDHKILTKTLSTVDRLLAGSPVDPEGARRAVLERLEVFSRLKGVLEHHTTREQRDFYPVLNHHLDEASRTDFSARLQRAVEGAPR